jgi:hypothetical protein
MRMSGRVSLIAVSLLLVLCQRAATQTSDKNKTVCLTNQQGAPAEVYINFAADSVLTPTDLPFCKVTGPLHCQFTLAAHSAQDFPNPGAKYLNMALAFNAPVNYGSTKAEVIANNPKWYDILDVTGTGECKRGSESKPDVPCQYQMNEPNGLIEAVLLPK